MTDLDIITGTNVARQLERTGYGIEIIHSGSAKTEIIKRRDKTPDIAIHAPYGKRRIVFGEMQIYPLICCTQLNEIRRIAVGYRFANVVKERKFPDAFAHCNRFFTKPSRPCKKACR